MKIRNLSLVYLMIGGFDIGLASSNQIQAASDHTTPISLRGKWTTPIDRMGHQLIIKITKYSLVDYNYRQDQLQPGTLRITGKKLTVNYVKSGCWNLAKSDKSIVYRLKKVHRYGKLALKTWMHYSHGPQHWYFNGYYYHK